MAIPPVPRRIYSMVLKYTYIWNEYLQTARNIKADCIIISDRQILYNGYTNAQILAARNEGIQTIILLNPTKVNDTGEWFDMGNAAVAEREYQKIVTYCDRFPAASGIHFEEYSMLGVPGYTTAQRKIHLGAFLSRVRTLTNARGMSLSFNSSSTMISNIELDGIDLSLWSSQRLMDFFLVQVPGTRAISVYDDIKRSLKPYLNGVVFMMSDYMYDSGDSGTLARPACQASIAAGTGWGVADCWNHDFITLVDHFKTGYLWICQTGWTVPVSWFNLPSGLTAGSNLEMTLNKIPILPLSEPPSSTRILDVTSTPTGASIRIQDAGGWGNYGQTPRTFDMNSAGFLGNEPYVVELTLAGYPVWTSTPITIPAGQTVIVEHTFTAPCVPAWACEQPLSGYQVDGCGNRQLNTLCDPLRVTEIKIIGCNEAIKEEQTCKLTGNCFDQNNDPIACSQLAWGSSNTMIAIVDQNGLVTGVTAGAVTIAAVKGTVAGYRDVTILTAKGSMNVSSSPAGVKIFVNDVDTGKVTPALITGIQEGPISIKLVKAGFVDIFDTAEILAGQTTAKAYTMNVVIEKGSLNISSMPTGAYIVLDDIPLKIVTPQIVPVLPGRHIIKLVLSGYEDVNDSEYIYEGQQVIKLYTMQKKSSGLAQFAVPITLGLGLLSLLKK